MPRKPRLHQPGAFFHVIMRGNAKQDIFSDVDDHRRFLTFVEEGINRFGHRVHGYCLMTNHVHLVVQVGEVPLSRVMQNLTMRYTKWVNWRQGRIGHVFHGRFKAIMVEADSYLTQLVGYLHLNPVRAGMVKHAEDYQWSSHRPYLGLNHVPWLTTEFVLAQFSRRESEAKKAFNAFVRGRSDEGHRAEFHGIGGKDSRLLGEDDFVEMFLEREPSTTPRATVDNVLAAVRTVLDVSMEDLAGPGQGVRAAEARALAAWGVRHHSSVTITDLAGRLNRDVSTLSSAANRLEKRRQTDSVVAAKMEAVSGELADFTSLQA